MFCLFGGKCYICLKSIYIFFIHSTKVIHIISYCFRVVSNIMSTYSLQRIPRKKKKFLHIYLVLQKGLWGPSNFLSFFFLISETSFCNRLSHGMSTYKTHVVTLVGEGPEDSSAISIWYLFQVNFLCFTTLSSESSRGSSI